MPTPSASHTDRPTAPLISVIISTRNRGALVCDTVRSILANTYPHFELIVVDQSTADTTKQAMAPFLADPRLRYILTATSGLSRAHNLGLAAAQAEIVAITDDDCEVPADWIAQMAAALAQDPRVGLVFCDVVAAPYDTGAGHVPVNLSPETRCVPSVDRWLFADGINIGIGAGMALRRAIVQEIGGFDPLLGAGGRFRSANDTDLTLRVLLRGYRVYRTNQIQVRHYGFRTFAEFRGLTRGHMFGLGATTAKLLKCERWQVLLVVCGMLQRTVLRPALASLLRLRTPRVLGRILYFARGFYQGWRTPVDRETMIFR